MDNFNLQSFVKKSKNEFYAKLYEQKAFEYRPDHTMDEVGHEEVKEKMHDNIEEGANGARIESLLNIPMKDKFLAAGHALITDLLKDDDYFDVDEVVAHLANELEKHYDAPTYGEEDYGSIEGGWELEEEKDLTNEVSLNASDIETAVAALGGILGLPAVAYLSQKAQDKLKALKAKGKEALKEEEGDEEIEVEDEIEVPAEADMDMGMDTDMEAPEGEAEDSKEIFSKLVDAYESAKSLGDEKLTRQLANTITYFNKSVIFGDSK